MPKRAVINLILLALIAALAAWLYWTGHNDTHSAPVTVSTIDPNSIDYITVTRSGQTELQFSKQQAGWRMLSPLPAPANNTRIKAMLAIINARSYTQLDAAGLDPDRFGIRDPAVMLKVNNLEFRFGSAAALDSRRYLLYQDQVHLIDDGLFQQLQQPPEFFIQSQDD